MLAQARDPRQSGRPPLTATSTPRGNDHAPESETGSSDHVNTPISLLICAAAFAAYKHSNLRDILASPPADWPPERKRQYFDWARQVVDQVRGANAALEAAFDREYARVIELA